MPTLGRPVEEGGCGFDYRLAMGLPDMWIKVGARGTVSVAVAVCVCVCGCVCLCGFFGLSVKEDL